MGAVRFVDVFSTRAFAGNALAVFHDAGHLDDEEMAAIARWTNLSETTFLGAPTDPAADYRVRIFTTGGELPFAGHPTLGSAHAWLEAGGRPQRDDVVVQECGAGLVQVRRDEEQLAFAAPPLLRSGPVQDADLAPVVTAMGLAPDEVVDAAWVDNGPGWMGLLLSSAERLLDLEPHRGAAAGMKVGIAAPYPEGSRPDQVALEVRAWYSDGADLFEDPVTGSVNAGLAQWLVGSGRMPARYVAAQGTAIGREGRVHIEADGPTVWVGGAVRTLVEGRGPEPGAGRRGRQPS